MPARVRLLPARVLTALAVVPALLAVQLAGAPPTAGSSPAGSTPDRAASIPGTPAEAALPQASYAGPAFAAAANALPPAHRPRHRLWFHDGVWWALMTGAADPVTRVHELMPDHTWRPTDAVVDHSPGMVGDALPAGDRLFVLGAGPGGALQIARMTYDPAARQYVMDSGFPSDVARQASPRATLTMDAEGRLWVAWASEGRVWVTQSDAEGGAWSPRWSPSPDLLADSDDEMVAVAAFGDAVGVMWSDQGREEFHFAVHRLADPPDVWTREVPLAGAGMVDDHVYLSVAPGESGDAVIAAVKTSQNDIGAAGDAPLVMVLVRAPDGSWTNHAAGTVADRVTRPVTLVDADKNDLHLFMQAPNAGGTIYHKQSRLPSLSFRSGPGEPWITGPEAALVDPSTTRQPVNARSGMVVMASDTVASRYWHGEQALPVPPGGVEGVVDEQPPGPPGDLRLVPASGSVDLRWAPAVDGERWAPAVETPPVAGYAVARDGVEIGTTARLFFSDSFPERGAIHEYSVTAIDLAGNRSEPVSATVETPASPLRWSWLLWGLLAVASLGAGYAATRRSGAPQESHVESRV